MGECSRRVDQPETWDWTCTAPNSTGLKKQLTMYTPRVVYSCASYYTAILYMGPYKVTVVSVCLSVSPIRAHNSSMESCRKCKSEGSIFPHACNWQKHFRAKKLKGQGHTGWLKFRKDANLLTTLIDICSRHTVNGYYQCDSGIFPNAAVQQSNGLGFPQRKCAWSFA